MGGWGDYLGATPLAMTDPLTYALSPKGEREIWIGRFAPFNRSAGLAMTDLFVIARGA